MDVGRPVVGADGITSSVVFCDEVIRNSWKVVGCVLALGSWRFGRGFQEGGCGRGSC